MAGKSKTPPKPKLIKKSESYPLDKLTPYDRNTRRHDENDLKFTRASIREHGKMHPIVADENGRICCGHGRYYAALGLQETTFPVRLFKFATEASFVAFHIADNRTAVLAEFLDDVLVDHLPDLLDAGFELDTLGYDDREYEALLASYAEKSAGEAGSGDPNAIPKLPKKTITKVGDVWRLGRHRLLCGDATKPEDVERLMGRKKAILIHADPPYGMGKEDLGIANDNLYGSKLDAFQMSWWAAFRPHVDNSASAYIWGNPADLWRLWYQGGLNDSERLTFRNEIAWHKGMRGFGVGSEGQRCYFPTERCLFFMLGEQGFNNNLDNYWEGWEPIRAYLEAEAEKMKWGPADIKRICGVGMFGHWFTKCQWVFIPQDHYEALQKAAKGKAFKKPYQATATKHGTLKTNHDTLKAEFYSTRAYFDNAHDNMVDVWPFDKVTGDDRHEHATPKPVEIVERILMSSSPGGALVVDPFLGSGPTVIAAERLGRQCYGMDIEPRYIDTVVARWEKFTGKKAKRLR